MNQRTARRLKDIGKLVDSYAKLKESIGKKKVLQRIKIRLRTMDGDDEMKVRTAIMVVTTLGHAKITSTEVMRRVVCLTDLSEFEVCTVLDKLVNEFKAAGIIDECSEDEFIEMRRRETVIDPEDAAINEYCEIELKRKYQHDLNDVMRAYS